jgi:hypothetical protein
MIQAIFYDPNGRRLFETQAIRKSYPTRGSIRYRSHPVRSWEGADVAFFTMVDQSFPDYVHRQTNDPPVHMISGDTIEIDFTVSREVISRDQASVV